LKVGLPCEATILLLGKYPKELKSGFWDAFCIFMIIELYSQ
jgi:hypothetical protein